MRWCSYCGGFSLWRLDEDQLGWLDAVKLLTECARSIRWNAEQFPELVRMGAARPSDPGWAGLPDRMTYLANRLLTLRETAPTLARHIDPLVEEAVAVRRRFEMRRDSSRT